MVFICLRHRGTPAATHRHHSQLNWSNPKQANRHLQDTMARQLGERGHFKSHTANVCSELLLPTRMTHLAGTNFERNPRMSTCWPSIGPRIALMNWSPLSVAKRE